MDGEGVGGWAYRDDVKVVGAHRDDWVDWFFEELGDCVLCGEERWVGGLVIRGRLDE